jgi:outer membrane receptor protein involved in Fe transport
VPALRQYGAERKIQRLTCSARGAAPNQLRIIFIPKFDFGTSTRWCNFDWRARRLLASIRLVATHATHYSDQSTGGIMARASVGRAGAWHCSLATFFVVIVVLCVAGVRSTAQAQSAATSAESAGQLEEVVVTATRRTESLQKVPISISTIGDEEMDARGVKNFEDLIRLTPGLNLSQNSATGANRVAIRGIASTAGTATTGIYIDDTPIQVTNLGFGSGNAFPGLFDVARVEVLRGPQGTLFGAGSEGGTVRFITTEPDATKNSQYARAEIATIDHGSQTYEAGLAFGGPLGSDKLAYRISGYYRREGGWIDLVNGTYQIVDPTGAAYANSVDFTRTSTLSQDINWNSTESFRLALKYTPTDTLTLTPAIYYNKRHTNDGAGNYFDLGTSDSGSHNYSRQGYTLGAPGTVYNVTAINAQGVVATQPLTLNAMSAPNNAFGDDRFTLSSLGINWDLGPVILVSNTSYFDRNETQWYDYTKGYVQYYSPEFFLESDRVTSTGNYPPLGWKAMSQYNNTQQNFVQELRLQSKDDAARLTWVAGLFYSHQKQNADQPINENFLINAPWVGFYPAAFGYGYYGVTGGPPFFNNCGHPGPCSAAQNFFGDSMLANAVSFLGVWQRTDEQFAAYAQADYKIVPELKLTLGLRVSHNKLDFNASYLGPENNGNAPFGFDCPTGPACPFLSGAYAPIYPTSDAHSSESKTTPKIGLTWQMNDNNMLYATAAEGFRPAGASLRVPSICNSDLIQNGYVDASGKPTQPTTYDSDSVWSYELGSKNRLLGGRLVLDSSVYLIKWKNIQANVELPDCSYNFVDNLANATSKGFDVAFQLKATEHLGFEGAVGYNKATFDENATSPNGQAVIYNGGSSIPDAGAPWTLSLSGDYAMPLASGVQGYFRADYTYTTEWRRYGTTDPGTPYYDPLLKPIPAYSLLNIRFGTQFKEFDVSLFVDNLTNSAPDLELTHSTYYDPQDWQNVTLQPRTIGMTLTWRK